MDKTNNWSLRAKTHLNLFSHSDNSPHCLSKRRLLIGTNTGVSCALPAPA